jgi:hypothetical protein
MMLMHDMWDITYFAATERTGRIKPSVAAASAQVWSPLQGCTTELQFCAPHTRLFPYNTAILLLLANAN